MAWFVGNVGQLQDHAMIRYADSLNPEEEEDDSFSSIGQDNFFFFFYKKPII
jgi:hypothetical protein